MNIREFNAKYLEPGAITLMVAGVIFLCQPWIAVLHQYSVLITLAGIIAFNVAVHIPAPERAEDEDAGSETAPGGSSHG